MYGLRPTQQIEQQLPVLLEYIRVMRADYIPAEVASASTIMYAVQEGLVERAGKQWTVTAEGKSK